VWGFCSTGSPWSRVTFWGSPDPLEVLGTRVGDAAVRCGLTIEHQWGSAVLVRRGTCTRVGDAAVHSGVGSASLN